MKILWLSDFFLWLSKFFAKWWSECSYCKKIDGTVEKRRCNSQYADDESNWMTSCLECFEEKKEILQEMWEEYYAGRL